MSRRPDVPQADAVLWERAAGGDAGAFGSLFERHADAVYNHCFRRTASWSAAEDLTSVVFLEAWRRRREVVLSSESILPWLLAVANNAIRNLERARRRHRRLLAKLPSEAVTPDVADDAAGRIDDERFMRGVLEAFDKLTPGEQDVLALCVWAGLSYTDAAVALGVPVGTLRSRLSRARSHLRRLAMTSIAAGPGSGSGSRPGSGGGSRSGPGPGSKMAAEMAAELAAELAAEPAPELARPPRRFPLAIPGREGGAG